MSKTLEEIAKQLRDANKKVQLIYAFNGTGKTRLSRAMKDLIAPKVDGEEPEPSRQKILYYNAFTEDLFYWDNDLNGDAEPKLIIQENNFTDWILSERGLDQDIIGHFQRYTDKKLTPTFVVETKQITNGDGNRENRNYFPAVTFAFDRGSERVTGVKISKGEESNLIWSIFYTLLQEVIEILKEPDPVKRDNNDYDSLECVFIDDPVSSLDENHLIELAIDLAGLISNSRFNADNGVKYVITTHNPLFFNVLSKGLTDASCYLLRRSADGNFTLDAKMGSANKSFSYHHHLLHVLRDAIDRNDVQKYHFNLLRNLYEKTANFLGYDHWTKLLATAPEERTDYLKKLANHHSHRLLAFEEIAEPTDKEQQDVAVLLDNLIDNYGFQKEDA
jgi:hypothetical protein